MPTTKDPTSRGRSPTKGKAAGRPQPSLSADRLPQYFHVSDSMSNEFGVIDYTWQPHDVRFVIWYYVTMHLSSDSIATAFNVTLGGNDDVDEDIPKMTAMNADFIIDTIKARSLDIRREILQRERLGLWPMPTEIGWIPCDHGMPCRTIAQASHGQLTSVMRDSKPRTRGAVDIQRMATDLWNGPTWEELLQCPRKHKDVVPANVASSAQSAPIRGVGQRSLRSGPGRRLPVQPVEASDSSGDESIHSISCHSESVVSDSSEVGRMLTSILFPESAANGEKYTSGPASQLRPSTRPAGRRQTETSTMANSKITRPPTRPANKSKSPAKSLQSTSQSRPKFTEAGMSAIDPGSSQKAIADNMPIVGGASLRGESARARTRAISSSRTRRPATHTNHADGELQQIDEESLITASNAPQRSVIKATYDFLGGSEAVFFVVQNIVRGLCFSCLLAPALEILLATNIHPLEILPLLNIRPILHYLVFFWGATEVFRYTEDEVRRFLWRQWRVDVTPPEASHLSGFVFMLSLGISCQAIVYLWPRWGQYGQFFLDLALASSS